MLYKFDKKAPFVGADVFVAENAAIIGDVSLADGASVWFGACIRGDEAHIEIGTNTNIQDNATVHAAAVLGEGITVGHNAIIHGCKIGDNTLIGMGAIVLDGARIGRNCIVGAGALVTKGKQFPDGSLIVGSPAVVKRALTEDEISGIAKNCAVYCELARKYRG